MNGVVFNHRIGEQLFAHIGQLRFGFRFVAFIQGHFDKFALAHAINAVKAKCAERVLNGFALRVEHAVFQRNVNGRFHV